MSEETSLTLMQSDSFEHDSDGMVPVLSSMQPQDSPLASQKVDARMVAYAQGKLVAFAPHATQELIEHPQWTHVPGAAYYAYGLLYWQERHIPFIHLESVLLAYPSFDDSVIPQYALVLAYQKAPREPLQYGAIAVTDIPYLQAVSDTDFSPLPLDSDMWSELAISCFRHAARTVPVLDAAKIFSKYHG